MININVYLTHALLPDELSLKDKNVIVVDVLRASTTMTIALANGAKEIIPTETTANAARIAKGSANSLLCGERSGKIVEGFDLGNSPLEYSSNVIKGKTLIFSTTNGTATILKTRHAKSCVLASFVNISAITSYINSLNEDVVIICSGKQGNFSLEDCFCSGAIINNLINYRANEFTLDDSAVASLNIYKNYISTDKMNSNEILHVFKYSEHGKYLASIGFEKDLEECSLINTFEYLPVYKNGVIKLKESIETQKAQKSQMKKINI